MTVRSALEPFFESKLPLVLLGSLPNCLPKLSAHGLVGSFSAWQLDAREELEPGGARLPPIRGLPLLNEEAEDSEDLLGVFPLVGSFVYLGVNPEK